MPERTIVYSNDVEQIALEALSWRESLQRNGVSPAEAVGHVLLCEGRTEIQTLLAPFGTDEVAQSINYYTDKLGSRGMENFQKAWGKIFAGVLIKHLDRTPAEGWSTQALLTDLNLAFAGTPLPPITFNTGSIYREDKNQTIFITQTLIANKQVGCFFQSTELFQQLTPVMEILKTHTAHSLTADVTEQGLFAQKCLDHFKQPTRPH